MNGKLITWSSFFSLPSLFVVSLSLFLRLVFLTLKRNSSCHWQEMIQLNSAVYWQSKSHYGNQVIVTRLTPHYHSSHEFWTYVCSLFSVSCCFMDAVFFVEGSGQGYHALTYGLYADQLIRRIDPQSRSLGKFFEEEIAKPFGIHCFIIKTNFFVIVS